MVFFLISIVLMIVLRSIAKRLFLYDNRIYIDNLNRSTFAALYFIPVLFLVHIIAGGIICKFSSYLFDKVAPTFD